MVEKAIVVSLASVLLLGTTTSAQIVFPASDVSGAFENPNGADLTLPTTRTSGGEVVVTRPDVTEKGTLFRMCGCSETQPEVDEIRGLSNTWLKHGVAPSPQFFSNLVWAWGQFIDHDIVATIDGDGPETEEKITLKDRGMTAVMKVHPLISDGDPSCPRPFVVNSPIVDAGTVYSDEPSFLDDVLRMENSCMLRTSGDGNMLPISTVRNGEGHYVFVAGDGRVDEHAVLTMMHTIWMREHNRLCDYMNRNSKFRHLTNDEKFDKARNVVIAKIQDITVREWLPVLGITEADLRHAKPLKDEFAGTAALSVEFSTASYRFGHDLVPDHLGPLPTVELFNGNEFFGIQETGKANNMASHKLDDVVMFSAQSRANKIDGKFSDTLRNTLFGEFGEDLGSRNIFRGRDMRLVDFGTLASCYHAEIATEIPDTVVPFIGLLQDNDNPDTNVFGPVQRAVLIEQFHRIFFGSGGDWWEKRLGAVAGFEDEIHDATMASVLNDNTRAFVQKKAFKIGGTGGEKQAPYDEKDKDDGPGDGPDGPNNDEKDDDDDKFGFEFPDFPDGFPKFP